MSEENFFSMKMAKLSDDELKNYVVNKHDFQDYAVLTAILELEKEELPLKTVNKLSWNLQKQLLLKQLK